MKFKQLIVLWLIVGNLLAQNNFEGIVTDIKRKEPLAFVNIGINKNIGIFFKSSGFFFSAKPLNRSIIIHYTSQGEYIK